MKIGINKETAPNERRVAATPESVRRFTDAGHSVIVEAEAGEEAGFADEVYRQAGAEIAERAEEVAANSEIILHVAKPPLDELQGMGSGTAIVGILDARQDRETIKAYAYAVLTSFSMELVPRIARAQSMDVLSSQASLAGYKAALIAAGSIGRFFPMMTTAAGTIPPAQVLVIGAGVAGLQAIATAKRLGAAVQAYDVRAAAAEQVQSLGARFISPEDSQDAETAGGYARAQTEQENQAQRAFLAEHVAKSDVVITTAAIPGREAPMLIENDVIAQMRPGSTIIDLAAESGGNTEATEAGKTVHIDGVAVHGPVNVPSLMPYHASAMYSRNVEALLKLLTDDEMNLKLDFDDEVVDAMCVTHNGEVRTHTIE